MKRILAWAGGTFAAFVAGLAFADLAILDGGGVSRTLFDFTCFTTKHCSAHVPITSAGAEIDIGGKLDTINTSINSPIPTNAPTNCSGTITSGGTAQSIIAAGTVHGIQIQNLATEALAFSWTTTTPAVLTNSSWTLNAGTASTSGGSYNSPLGLGLTTAVYIIGATTGSKFSCAWW